MIASGFRGANTCLSEPMKRKPRQQSPKSATRSVWLFDVDQFRPGDVVLGRGPRLMSRAVRAADRAKYTHALIFLGGTDFLEAVGADARVISHMRFPIGDPANWAVLRHPEGATAQRAAHEARALAHRDNGATAFRSIMPFRFADDPCRVFCSQLVAQAYERVGAPLVTERTPVQITPRLLHKKSSLNPLEHVPVRPLAARNIPSLDRDADYTRAGLAQETRASQAAFRAVRPELDALNGQLGAGPKPASLVELLQALGLAEARGRHEAVAPVMTTLHRALEHERYFDLYPSLARAAEATLQGDLAFASAHDATPAERAFLARHSAELAAAYGETASRLEANAAWFQTVSKNSRAALWLRLAHMSNETAQATRSLIRVAQSVSERCAALPAP